MHEVMGMDKVDNIKSAVASAALNVRNSKGHQSLEGGGVLPSKSKPNIHPSRTNIVNPLKERSAVATKTLAETLKVNEERVRDAVKEINNELAKLQSELGFSVDKVADDVVITVKRKESGEVVRQIPSETALKLAHNFEKLKGILLDETF